MDCYSGSALLLLAIIAALFFIFKSKSENGSALLRWIAWATIFIAFVCLGCLLRNCLRSGCCEGKSNCSKMESCHHGKGMMHKEKSCRMDDGCEPKMHCCEGDSMKSVKVMVDDDGDTVRIEKHIKVVKDKEDKKE